MRTLATLPFHQYFPLNIWRQSGIIWLSLSRPRTDDDDDDNDDNLDQVEEGRQNDGGKVAVRTERETDRMERGDEQDKQSDRWKGRKRQVERMKKNG